MNELKDTYMQCVKDSLQEMAQSCMSEEYQEFFAVDVDEKTGDFILICLKTGSSVSIAENDLSETPIRILPEIIMRIVEELLIKHIKENAFKWGKL